MVSAIGENFPFPFTLQSPFFRRFASNKVLSRNSDTKKHFSIVIATEHLKNKLRLSDSDQIDYTSRFRAFHSLPKNLHLLERKSLNNFFGIAHIISQRGLCNYDMCSYYNEGSERDTLDILFYPFDIIVSCKEDMMESFPQRLLRENRDDETLLLLSQVMTNDQCLSTSLRHEGLQIKLHEFGLNSR